MSFFIDDFDWIDRDASAKLQSPRAGVLCVGEIATNAKSLNEDLPPYVADECPVVFEDAAGFE